MDHLTIREVLPWLRSKLPGITFYNSFVDQEQTSVVGVYQRRNGRVQPSALGKHSSYGVKSMTLLVRGTANAGDSEKFAIDIWEQIRASGANEQIGDTTVWVEANSEPHFAGRDEKNIFEYVVDFEIYYRK